MQIFEFLRDLELETLRELAGSATWKIYASDESILATVLRLAIWVIIWGLMFFAHHRKIDLHA